MERRALTLPPYMGRGSRSPHIWIGARAGRSRIAPPTAWVGFWVFCRGLGIRILRDSQLGVKDLSMKKGEKRG